MVPMVVQLMARQSWLIMVMELLQEVHHLPVLTVKRLTEALPEEMALQQLIVQAEERVLQFEIGGNNTTTIL